MPVKVGRASVNSIQVLEGLHEGDTVILSDMSRWDNYRPHPAGLTQLNRSEAESHD